MVNGCNDERQAAIRHFTPFTRCDASFHPQPTSASPSLARSLPAVLPLTLLYAYNDIIIRSNLSLASHCLNALPVKPGPCHPTLLDQGR